MADTSPDWQLQLEELLALSSILEPEDFTVLAVEGVDLASSASASSDSTGVEQLPSPEDMLNLPPPQGRWRIQIEIAIHVDVPSTTEGIHLQLKLAQNKQDNDEQQHQPDTTLYTVKHLPPIILCLALSPDYPSSQSPLITSLSAPWLTQQQCEDVVQHQLAALWEEQGGAGVPIIYTWFDWLQHSLLQHVGYDIHGVSLATACCGGDDNTGDSAEEEEEQAADQQHHHHQLESLLLSLLRYNTAREYQLFARSMQTCPICFDEIHGSKFCRLDCNHCFCRSCLQQQAEIHVTDGSLDALKCPDPSCGRPLEPGVLKELLSEEQFARWDQLTLQRALDRMSDTAYCPRCQSVALEDEDSHAACPKCLFDFCSLCEEAWHPGVTCVSAETKLEMLRRKAAGGGAAAVAELRRKEHEFLSLAAIEKSSKPCPQCGIAVERTSGCNKMTCTQCSANWCYKCGKQIKGYDHYKEGINAECVLFDEAEVLRWERQWAGMVQQQQHEAAFLRNEFIGGLNGLHHGFDQADAGVDGGRQWRNNNNLAQAANCPQCGQLNFKIARNNHINCWSCSKHFCALCRQVLQGKGGTHFGPNKCKQHT